VIVLSISMVNTSNSLLILARDRTESGPELDVYNILLVNKISIVKNVDSDHQHSRFSQIYYLNN